MWSVYTVDVETGKSARMMRSAGAYADSPIPSPDGRTLFVATRHPFTIGVDGFHRRRVSLSWLTTVQAWSPDGKRLAYTPAGDETGIWTYDLASGRRTRISFGEYDATPSWSPDGKRIAFTSTTLTRDFAKDGKQDEKSDVRVINRIEYRNNSGGYVDFERPAHIWVTDVPAVVDGPVKPRPITTGPFTESDLVWSRDGSHIYFLSDHTFEPVSRRRIAQ